MTLDEFIRSLPPGAEFDLAAVARAGVPFGDILLMSRLVTKHRLVEKVRAGRRGQTALFRRLEN